MSLVQVETVYHTIFPRFSLVWRCIDWDTDTTWKRVFEPKTNDSLIKNEEKNEYEEEQDIAFINPNKITSCLFEPIIN